MYLLSFNNNLNRNFYKKFHCGILIYEKSNLKKSKTEGGVLY
jgi:hypothetical protein